MFCFQCQETARGTGCTVRGVCGKLDSTSALMDLLIDNLEGIAVLEERAAQERDLDRATGLFVLQSLFMTITNANFDEARLTAQIEEALRIKRRLLTEVGDGGALPASATWFGGPDAFAARAAEVGVLAEPDENGKLDKLNKVYRRVISMQERINGVNTLSTALRTLIMLERQAFNIEGALVDPDVTKDTQEVVKGLDTIMAKFDQVLAMQAPAPTTTDIVVVIEDVNVSRPTEAPATARAV